MLLATIWATSEITTESSNTVSGCTSARVQSGKAQWFPESWKSLR